jgi:hypothetical protein
MPAEGFVEYALANEQTLREAMPQVERLPWDDFVLEIPVSTSLMAEELGHRPFGASLTVAGMAAAFGMEISPRTWIRVQRSDQVKPVPWVPQWDSRSDLEAEPLVLTIFRPTNGRPTRRPSAEDVGLPAEFIDQVYAALDRDAKQEPISVPDVLLANAAAPWSAGTSLCTEGCPSFRGRAEVCPRSTGKTRYATLDCQQVTGRAEKAGRIAMLCLAYLTACEEYIVEVAPEDVAFRERPSPKPWTEPREATYILLDPARVREYGHPSAAPVEAGSHTSPVPHQRRGHWRHLRAAIYLQQRRVWVRPSWVGASAWRHQGQRYRVMFLDA